jgi:hypothetical protein
MRGINALPAPDTIRMIPRSFAWLDHRLRADGYLVLMEAYELRLYLFLVLAADRDGASNWSDMRIAQEIGVTIDHVALGRELLIRRGLIAYARPVYQVLSLPESPNEGRLSVAQAVKTLSKRFNPA